MAAVTVEIGRNTTDHGGGVQHKRNVQVHDARQEVPVIQHVLAHQCRWKLGQLARNGPLERKLLALGEDPNGISRERLRFWPWSARARGFVARRKEISKLEAEGTRDLLDGATCMIVKQDTAIVTLGDRQRGPAIVVRGASRRPTSARTSDSFKAVEDSLDGGSELLPGAILDPVEGVGGAPAVAVGASAFHETARLRARAEAKASLVKWALRA